MKRIVIALALAALMCMAAVFAACAGKDEKDNSGGDPTPAPSEQTLTEDPTALPEGVTEAPVVTEDTQPTGQADATPGADSTEQAENTEESSGTIITDDEGDVIIVVPSGQGSGGLGGNP